MKEKELPPLFAEYKLSESDFSHPNSSRKVVITAKAIDHTVSNDPKDVTEWLIGVSGLCAGEGRPRHDRHFESFSVVG